MDERAVEVQGALEGKGDGAGMRSASDVEEEEEEEGGREQEVELEQEEPEPVVRALTPVRRGRGRARDDEWSNSHDQGRKSESVARDASGRGPTGSGMTASIVASARVWTRAPVDAFVAAPAPSAPEPQPVAPPPPLPPPAPLSSPRRAISAQDEANKRDLLRRAEQRVLVDAFVKAAGYGDVEEVVRLMMMDAVDVNAYGGEDRITALYSACERNQISTVNVLLEQCPKSKGLDVQKCKEVGLDHVMANRYSSSRYWRLHRKIKKQEKELSKIKDRDDQRHMKESIQHADEEMREIEKFHVKRLTKIRALARASLSRGEPPGEMIRREKERRAATRSRKGTLGRSPLIVACEKGHVDVARLLLNHGASADFPTLYNGWYPLHFAAKNGHAEIVRLLLSHNAKIDRLRLEDEATALWLAASRGSTEIVKILLDSGANMEARTQFGMNTTGVLGAAALRGNSSVCVILLSHSYYMNPANKAVRLRDVKEALTLAFRAGHWQLGIDLTRDNTYRHTPSAVVFGFRALWWWRPHGKRIVGAAAIALAALLLSIVMLGPLSTLRMAFGATFDVVCLLTSLPLILIRMSHAMLAHGLGGSGAIQMEILAMAATAILRPAWILFAFKLLYAGAMITLDASRVLVDACLAVHNKVAVYLKQPELKPSVKFQAS